MGKQSESELMRVVRAKANEATGLSVRRVKRPATELLLATRFCGDPYAERGETWPICACEQPLSFIAQFNMDAGLHTSEFSGLYCFYYCQECASWGDIPEDLHDAWIVRRHEKPDSGKFVALKPPSRPPWIGKACEVTQHKILSLPDWEDADLAESLIARMSDDPWEAYALACAAVRGADAEPDSKIGGHPQWIQGSNAPKCKTCEGPMPLLAEIGSEEAADLMWGDAGSVYLFDCPKHPGNVQMCLQCY